MTCSSSGFEVAQADLADKTDRTMSQRSRSPTRSPSRSQPRGGDGEEVGASSLHDGQSKEAEPSAAPTAEPAGGAGVSPPPTGAASSSADILVDPATVPPMNLLAHIDILKAEKRRLKEEKKNLAKTLKNAEKRRARLKRKARQLSDKDLTDVIQLRKSEQAANESKARPPAGDVEPPAEKGAS